MNPMSTFGTTGSLEKLAQTLIQESEANILDIDAKIADLTSQIRDLACLRELERGKLATLRGIIVPIRKLPMELLARIFLMVVEPKCCNQNPQISQGDVMRLSQVSAYWRKVAHSMPRLWATPITLRLKKKPTDGFIAVTKAWMDRSSPLPIDIIIKTSLPNADLVPSMDVLLSVAHRLKSLTATLESVASFTHLPSNALAKLESLYLSVTNAQGGGFNISAFANAPCLTTVHLGQGINMTPLPGIPWNQLTAVRLTHPSPESCCAALVLCENVETANITTCAWPVGSVRTTKTLPFLKNLGVGFTMPADGSRGDVTPFFDSFRLPALTTLDLILDGDDIEWPAASLERFQQHSPNIQSLTLFEPWLESAELINLLSHSPTLTELELYCVSVENDVLISRLQFRDSDPQPLVPMLTTLRIMEAAPSFPEAALEQMIRSRWWSDEQLAALVVPPRVARLKCVRVALTDSSFRQEDPGLSGRRSSLGVLKDVSSYI
ncbi:hypothetical protein C8J57DRAFT_1708629 [Mycena rebaudengoi]|nr:hypothetical protein C8J57DRAFT_1708629 [Mycena rebaudengoi]